MKAIKLVVLATLVSTLLMSFSTSVKKWDFLGQRKVNFSIDRDEIQVTAREGTFKKIKLKVSNAPVHFRKVVVYYRNGTSESVIMKSNIKAGGETRAIDLKGNNRIIKRVEFYYNTRVKAPRRAVVKLYGMHR